MQFTQPPPPPKKLFLPSISSKFPIPPQILSLPSLIGEIRNISNSFAAPKNELLILELIMGRWIKIDQTATIEDERLLGYRVECTRELIDSHACVTVTCKTTMLPLATW